MGYNGCLFLLSVLQIIHPFSRLFVLPSPSTPCHPSAFPLNSRISKAEQPFHAPDNMPSFTADYELTEATLIEIFGAPLLSHELDRPSHDSSPDPRATPNSSNSPLAQRSSLAASSRFDSGPSTAPTTPRRSITWERLVDPPEGPSNRRCTGRGGCWCRRCIHQREVNSWVEANWRARYAPDVFAGRDRSPATPCDGSRRCMCRRCLVYREEMSWHMEERARRMEKRARRRAHRRENGWVRRLVRGIRGIRRNARVGQLVELGRRAAQSVERLVQTLSRDASVNIAVNF